MHKSIRLNRVVAVILFFVAATLLHASEPVKYDLRVYGPVSSAEQSVPAGASYRIVRLTAQDHAKAVIVMSKALADFTTLPVVAQSDIMIGKLKLSILRFESGRALLPVLQGQNAYVDFYSFPTADSLAAFISAPHPELANAAYFPTRQYPLYLDRWDRHAMGSWYSQGRGPWFRPDLSDDADFAFFRANGLSINGIENVYGTAARAARSDMTYKMNRWFDVSNYAYDGAPGATLSGDPDLTAIYDYYGEVPFAENPNERAQIAEMVRYLSQFTKDDHFESITSPHGETGPSSLSYQGFRDRDEYSRQDFIHYLRDLRKLSLTDLGSRWYGNAKYFAAWQDVRFPREREFYGWKDSVSQSLSGEWRMRYVDRDAGVAANVSSPAYDDSNWFQFKTGAQPLAGARKPGWVRRSFVVDAVIAKALSAKKPVYMTVCPFAGAPYANPSTAYLNGTKLGDMTLGYGNEWAQYDVSALLNAKKPNYITVYSPNACVHGPVFLTVNKAEKFPTSDDGLNARLYDVREWVADCVARANLRYLEYLRGIDPARPVKIMAFDSMIDVMMPYAQLEGAYPHCTGESAFFRPWFKRYGYLRGVNDSSEPSQPAKNVNELTNLFFCMTMEGVNAHDYFIHLHSITADPAMKAWYVSRLANFQLMGKFDLKKPEIVLARSVKVDRVSPQGENSSYENDPGRGDIQESHNGYLFCSEIDLRQGLVDNYKVIVDCNFHSLEPADIDALTKYVQNGGTLVLNQRSGRDAFIKPLTWPISTLTGCEATVRPMRGNVTFEANPSILKSYAGKSFPNKDNLYDWQKRDYFSDCISLKPRGNDVQVVARYDDGAPAIVTRKVGKGLVVVLGSSFYRDSHDTAGYFVPAPSQTVFYKALFRDLGVSPLIESDQDKLWAERFVANNGSTEMLILGNKNADVPLEDASATWTLDFTPSRVFDPATGITVPAKIDGNRVVISHLTLAPLDMRYYAVERANVDAVDTVNHWLFRQSQLWAAVPEGRPMPKMDPAWPLYAVGEFQVKQFESESEALAAAAPEVTTDGTWRSMLRTDWVSVGMRLGKNIAATYRKTIDVDPAWLKGIAGAQLIPGRFDSGIRQMAINGLTIVEKSNVVNQDKLAAAIKPGPNLLTVVCTANNEGNGGLAVDFCIRRIPGADGVQLDISKGWDIYSSDVDKTAADLPWTGSCMLARKSVIVPEKYKGGDVWMKVESGGFVAVNGRWRYSANGYGAKYTGMQPLLVNITPDIKFGQANDIWLGGPWHDGIRSGPCTFQSASLLFTARTPSP
ncbi:MAG TPA: beta-galactosidase trimerization domain-containing protein [Capsulimonadaceae bacterium]